MTSASRRLLVIITEALIERDVIALACALGAKGYTAIDCRGAGSRGTQDGPGELARNVRIEVVCDAATAAAVTQALHERFYRDYGMIIYAMDVTVLRPDKF